MVTAMRIIFMTAILIGVALPSLPAGQTTVQRPPVIESRDVSSVVSTYCAGCHNAVMRSPSGAALDQFDAASISSNPDTWTRAYRQLQAGTMPPAGARRPDRPTSDALLASIERALGGTAAPPGDATSEQIADQLALLLWNSAPDAALLADARGNRLRNAATLARQIARMLADDRSRAFVRRFFVPWLGLHQLGKKDPDPAQFPDFTVSLRDAMAAETELFLLSQLRDDRDPIELWSANYTFLNEQLARHYGVAGVTGTQFRRVVVSKAERAGLLGHGSVLMVTSRHGKETAFTSPATRGLWVRLHFAGAPGPRPFPGAEPVNPALPITPQTRTLPAQPCLTCHANFFPLGYALENFDAIGRWRTRDQAGPVDASGTFVDGTPTDGVVQLRDVLLQRPDAFRTTITEKLLIYAAGQPVTASRMAPETLVRARQILNTMTDVRWSSILAAIVRSTPQGGR
jgi:hypothetical protein